MSDFRIDVSWLPPSHGPAEIAQTAAAVEIKALTPGRATVEDAFVSMVREDRT